MESQIKKIHQQLMSKQISCTGLVQEKLALLKQNTHNTVNFLLEETALALAKKVDAKIENGEEIGLLEGIPFGVKDVYMLQGTHTTASSDLLKKVQSFLYGNCYSEIIRCWCNSVGKRKLRFFRTWFFF